MSCRSSNVNDLFSYTRFAKHACLLNKAYYKIIGFNKVLQEASIPSVVVGWLIMREKIDVKAFWPCLFLCTILLSVPHYSSFILSLSFTISCFLLALFTLPCYPLMYLAFSHSTNSLIDSLWPSLLGFLDLSWSLFLSHLLLLTFSVFVSSPLYSHLFSSFPLFFYPYFPFGSSSYPLCLIEVICNTLQPFLTPCCGKLQQ